MKNLLITFILILVSTGLFAQSIAELENRIQLEQQRLNQFKKEQSGNSAKLKLKSAELENLKQSGGDLKEINRNQANLQQILRDYEKTKKEQNRLVKYIRELKSQLQKAYRVKIEALQEKLASEPQNKIAIRNEIEIFKQKQFLMQPDISGFTFDPARIQYYIENSPLDSLEQQYYLEYLSAVLDSVKNKLTQLNHAEKGVEIYAGLESKLTEFESEIESGADFGFVSQSQADKSLSMQREGHFGGFDPVTSNDAATMNTTIQLYQQLDIIPQSEDDLAFIRDAAILDTTLTLEEYVTLIGKAKQKLESYRMVIENKLRELR